MISVHCYEIRRRKDKRGVDLILDALPFGRMWYAGPNAVANAIGYAKHRSRSHDAVIRVYDHYGQVQRVVTPPWYRFSLVPVRGRDEQQRQTRWSPAV